MFGRSGGHSVTPLTERSRVGANIGSGINQLGQGIAQGITASKQAKAERKMNSTIVRELANFGKTSGAIDEGTAERYLQIAESGSNAEIKGLLSAYLSQSAMRAQLQAQSERTERLNLAKNSDARAQEQHQAQMKAMPQQQEMQAKAFEMNRERHQAQMEAAQASLDQQEQTNQMALEVMKGPQTVTEVNVPVPGMDTVAGRTAPEPPTVTHRKQTQREMVMAAAAKNPKARIGDIIKQMGANQPSVSDQIAVQKYQDSIKAREVVGVGLARTPQAAKETIEFKTTVEDANKGIEGLLAILDTPGRVTNAAKRAEAKTLTSLLKGSLRLPIVGPGAMSEKEMALLDDVVANPTKVFKINTATRASLEKLKSILNDQLETRYINNIEGYQPPEKPVAVWSGYSMDPASRSSQIPASSGHVMK